MTNFELQFNLNETRALAARYSYDEDETVLAIGQVARTRGWYTRPEFIDVCRWKTPRAQPLVAANSASTVEEATRISLGATAEEVRIGVLMALRGVSWPTASVLLHLAHLDRYPILDYRALEALGFDTPPTYSMGFWLSYVQETRRLAAIANVDMRTLDRALWQWSKERSSARQVRAPAPPYPPRRTPLQGVAADPSEPDAIILGCVSSKRRGSAKARDLYTSPLFEKRRRYAESTGLPWVILSAKHGILDPDDVIEWYDVALAHLPAQIRRGKGLAAAAQLEERLGPLQGKVFEIHAGAAYVNAIDAPLRARGAHLTNPLEGLGLGYQLQWYGSRRRKGADT